MGDQRTGRDRQKPAASSKGGPKPEAIRQKALAMLAEGHTVAATAVAVKAKPHTVAAWRDSPEGQRVLDAAREKRVAALEGAATKARRIFEEAAARAAMVLVDQLDASAPNVKVRAAREILGRVGVPTLTESRVTVADDGLDLSRLSLEQLQQLDELNRLARGEG